MALPISVTYTFATATSAIPLSQIDSNFTTVVNGINGIGNGTNALSNVSITGGTITGLSSAIPIASGGTGLTTTPANGTIDIGNGTGFTRATLTAGTNITITNGSGAITISSTGGSSGVSTISFGTTGLTPNTASSGAVTVAGTLIPANGGTGLTSVGASGNVLTSDGTYWVSQTSSAVGVPTGAILNSSVSSAPSGYLACNGSIYSKASYSALATAIGNIRSNVQTISQSISGEYVSYVNSRVFLTIGNGTSYVSSDSGATWTSFNPGSFNPGFTRSNVAWNGTRYVLAGRYIDSCSNTPGIFYSTNGTTWTNVTTNVNYYPVGVVWTGSRFVTTRYNDSSLTTSYSTDGVTWTAGGSLPTGFTAISIAYGNSIVVVVGFNATSKAFVIATSADGATWTTRTPASGFVNYNNTYNLSLVPLYYEVTYANNLFIATDYVGNVMSSADGVTWTLKYASTAGQVMGLIPGARKVVWSAQDSTYYCWNAYSADLTSWTVIANTLNGFGNGATDGTRLYNFFGGVYTPYTYNTSTQFLVPFKTQDPNTYGSYYYIKT